MITRTRFALAVPDLKVSAAFYRDVLGFTIHAIPDPGFLFYTLGECTIMAGQCPDALHPSRLGDHSYFSYLEMPEVAAYYATVRANGATICKELKVEPWGMQEFGLVTADGHRIMFASPSR